jgi:ketosteroid isomerase-like protein
VSDLESRIQRLEDIEEIKQLKAEYCRYCDEGYVPDGIAGLYTEDGIWDGGTTFGRVQGRDAIRSHFQGAAKRISIARHQVMNPIITVDGDEATGHWLLFQPCTDGPTGGAVWLAATYADIYRREPDRWRIAETHIDIAFFTPYEKGWSEQQFLTGREPS